MDRAEIASWLESHPGAVHKDVERLLDRCEAAVRRRAAEAAWLRAKEVAEERLRDWEGSYGLPASEVFVARELCHQLAQELRRLEPQVEEGSEERLAGNDAFAALEPEAREQLRRWVHDLAAREEHRVWLEILRFTDQRGPRLEREGRMSKDLSWDPEHSYARTAEKVMHILVDDYEAHAHPRPRG
jgi:hypothetical protein